MFAEDGVFKVPCPPGTPVFGGEFRGKDAIKKLFLEDDPDLIEGLVVEKPLEYFCNGDRVVVLTSYAYTIKKTGAIAKGKDIALVLDFADGRISVATEIQDLSEWADAYSQND
nr:nuclear transport factor 2 family protein [Jiangella mangrovi]